MNYIYHIFFTYIKDGHQFDADGFYHVENKITTPERYEALRHAIKNKKDCESVVIRSLSFLHKI